jgi:hypothetical protein
MKDQIENEEEPMWRKKQARRAFLAWVEPSTIQGLPNIFRTNFAVFRGMWAVSFFVALVLSAFIISLSVSNFLNFEVVT